MLDGSGAFVGGLAQFPGEDVQGGGDFLFAGRLGCVGSGRVNHGAGIVAFADRVAQGGLDHAKPGFQLAAALLGLQQLGLHLRHLFQGHGKAVLRGQRLGRAGVAFLGQFGQARLERGLGAGDLVAGGPCADRVDGQDRACNQRPAKGKGDAADADQLGQGTQADEPGIVIGPQEQALFRQNAFQRGVEAVRHIRQIMSPDNAPLFGRGDLVPVAVGLIATVSSWQQPQSPWFLLCAKHRPSGRKSAERLCGKPASL